MASKTHIYRGVTIRPCVYAKGQHAGDWVIQSYHESGTPWSDEACAHAQTLAEAKSIIDQEQQDS